MRSYKLKLLKVIMDAYNIDSSTAEDIFWQAMWYAYDCDWQMPFINIIHNFIKEDDYFSYETDSQKALRIRGIAP